MSRRVLIEAEKATRHRMQGTQRYVRNLLASLARLAPLKDCELFVLIGGEIQALAGLDLQRMWQPDASGRTTGSRSRFRRVLAPLESVPAIAEVRRKLGRRRISARANQRWKSTEPFDLVHLTSPHSFRSLEGLNSKFVGTVLDLTHRRVPETHLERTIAGTEEGLHYMARQAVGAIAISESTRRDFLEFYDFLPERIRVVPLGVDHSRFSTRRDLEVETAVLAKYGITRSFALTLATIEPRKNIDGILQSWEQLRDRRPDLDADLVIAGGVGWKSEQTLRALRSGKDSAALAIGFVDDEDLPALLRAATCFCYVSHYEGFGLPLLEAMSCGTPVIYGDNSSMPEVVGPAGLGVGSHDIVGIARALEKLFDDAALRACLSDLAAAQAALFSWDRTARETLEVYRELW